MLRSDPQFREILRERFIVNRRPAPMLQAELDSQGLRRGVVTRSTIAAKLHPSRFGHMTDGIRAILGYVLQENYVDPAISQLVIEDGIAYERIAGTSEFRLHSTGSALITCWDALLDAAELTDTERRFAQALFEQRILVLPSQSLSAAKPCKATGEPLRFPSGREVKGINKQILEDCLRDHPTLTVEECLEMMEAFGC